jgi:putative FmdB family regulatory protein
MPTYEYECSACGHTFEKFQSMKARPVRKCPECGKSKVQRLIGSGAGIIFKGSGFYETDYKRSGNASGSSEKKSDGESGGSKDSSSSGSSDTASKPESASSSKSTSSDKKD